MPDPDDVRFDHLEEELTELRTTIVKLQEQLDGCRAAILSVLRQVPESFLPSDEAMSELPDDDDLIES